ncbi:type 1 fimbrial protein [Roseateles sp.]|uniref:fimbrial protein n=1 Tax=Roseateles sp. TaxID=1971397 RepID=UPI002DFFAE98|nr:type 1 fimbrial protein [Roseateles sp.]
MLKKTAALSLLALAAGGAYAVDGTVTVTGTVTGVTCLISAPAVTLPTVSTTALASNGAVAGLTSWTVTTSGCTGTGATATNAYIEPGSTINTSGRITKTSGTATNVEVQMLTSGMVVMDLSKTYGSQYAGQTTNTVALNSGQTFYLRYYATPSGAGAGTFTSSFTYTLVYS